MKYKLILLVLIILVQGASKASVYNNNFTDIPVGTKVNDSTGVVTITIAQIQSFISTIPILSGKTMLPTQPIISVSDSSSYLIFQVSASSDTMNVAAPLTISSNTFYYAADVNQKVFICKSYNDCTGCFFGRDAVKKIIGCYVKRKRPGDENSPEYYLIKD